MSPSSSISSSEAGRWLGVVAALALLTVVAVCALNWWGVSRGLVGWEATRLQREQLRKIEAAPSVDVVLLGDSTLGNAVDARAWSEATGLQVLAVPLTGRYGYEGSLNLLRRVVARHRPRIVVVMQALDMPTRRISWEGLLFTAEQWSDLAGAPLWRLIPPLANLDLTGAMLETLARPERPVLFDAHGYIPQVPVAQRQRVVGPFAVLDPAEIRPDKQRYLREIGALCQRIGASCIYLFGPYPTPACEASRDYVAAADRFVRGAGLEPAPGTPICLPPAAVGDAEDHVHPAMKDHYSELYRQAAAAVAPALGVRHEAQDGSRRATRARHLR